MVLLKVEEKVDNQRWNPVKINYSGNGCFYDEVANVPYIKPRKNGKPWKRRVLKKKKKKAWKILDAVFEKFQLHEKFIYTEICKQLVPNSLNSIYSFVPNNVAPIDTGGY